jgi:MOSC domain-containing protein YiiM/GNAT superfamily N-acetyltransferase
MDGRVHQVNVSPGGVPKLPVEAARVGRQGLEGDAHRHRYVHGGPHRAVCLMAIEAIERVRADGHAIEPGAVGENLTTVGIELSTLPVGTRLAIGEDVLLEISSPANPCDVIQGAFTGGKSGRISIRLHPTDSRMYARVLAEGVVRRGDGIRVLPPAAGSNADVHQLLDLIDHVERDAWLTMWRAAAAAGCDVRILENGELVAAASPDLPGSEFNRAYGMRQIPIVLPEVEAFFDDAGTSGWAVADAGGPPWPGAVPEDPTGVHVSGIDDALERAASTPPPDGLRVRWIDPDDGAEVDRWARLFVTAFEIEEPEAGAWARFNRALATSKGQRELIASLDGRDVAVAATFSRRRVSWLGGAAVLPEARGLGIQRALIAERVRHAAEAGSHRVMATAAVGSVSGRNLEAMGLRRIWTRALYPLISPGSTSSEESAPGDGAIVLPSPPAG